MRNWCNWPKPCYSTDWDLAGIWREMPFAKKRWLVAASYRESAGREGKEDSEGIKQWGTEQRAWPLHEATDHEGKTSSRTISFQSSWDFHGPGDQSSVVVGGGGKEEREVILILKQAQELKLDGKQSGSLPEVNKKTYISTQTMPRGKSRHRICFRRSKGS